MIACAVVDLPEPDSPTIARLCPRYEGDVDAVDGLDEAVLGAEPDLEVLDLEERTLADVDAVCLHVRSVHGLAHRWALAFGSSASRMTSPSMMKLSTVIDSAIDG